MNDCGAKSKLSAPLICLSKTGNYRKTRRLYTKEIHELHIVISGNGYTREETKRAQAILLLDREEDIDGIRGITGYGRAQIFELRKRYLEEGAPCLKDKREGKPKELLAKREREEIIETVKTKTPKDLGFVSEHWTTGILGNWIDRKYKVKYKSKTSLYLIFKKAAFTYHKPGHVYHEHDEKAVEEWKTSTKPKLKKLLQERACLQNREAEHACDKRRC